MLNKRFLIPICEDSEDFEDLMRQIRAMRGFHPGQPVYTDSEAKKDVKPEVAARKQPRLTHQLEKMRCSRSTSIEIAPLESIKEGHEANPMRPGDPEEEQRKTTSIFRVRLGQLENTNIEDLLGAERYDQLNDAGHSKTYNLPENSQQTNREHSLKGLEPPIEADMSKIYHSEPYFRAKTLLESEILWNLENNTSSAHGVHMLKIIDVCHELTFRNADWCFLDILTALIRKIDIKAFCEDHEEVLSAYLSYCLLCDNFYHRLLENRAEPKIHFFEPEFVHLDYPIVSVGEKTNDLVKTLCTTIVEGGFQLTEETMTKIFCISYDSLTTLSQPFLNNNYIQVINFILTDGFIPGLCNWPRFIDTEIIEAKYVYVKRLNPFYLISSWLSPRSIEEKREFIIRSKSHRLLNLFLSDFYQANDHNSKNNEEHISGTSELPDVLCVLHEDSSTIEAHPSDCSLEATSFLSSKTENCNISASDCGIDHSDRGCQNSTIFLSKTIFEDITNTACTTKVIQSSPKSAQIQANSVRYKGVHLRKYPAKRCLNHVSDAINAYFLDLLIESYDPENEAETTYTNTIFLKLFQIESHTAEIILKEFILATKTNKLASVFFDKCKIIDSYFIEVCLICENFLDNISPLKLVLISQSHYFPFLTRKLENFVTAIKKLKNLGSIFDAEQAGHALFQHNLTMSELSVKKFHSFLEAFPYVSKSMSKYFRNLSKDVMASRADSVDQNVINLTLKDQGVGFEPEKRMTWVSEQNNENMLLVNKFHAENAQSYSDLKHSQEREDTCNANQSNGHPTRMFMNHFYQIMNHFRDEMIEELDVRCFLNLEFRLFLEICLFPSQKCYDVFFVRSFNNIAKAWAVLYDKKPFLDAFLDYKAEMMNSNSFTGIISSKLLDLNSIVTGCFFERILQDILSDRKERSRNPYLLKTNQVYDDSNNTVSQESKIQSLSDQEQITRQKSHIDVNIGHNDSGDLPSNKKCDSMPKTFPDGTMNVQVAMETFFYTSSDLVKILLEQFYQRTTNNGLDLEKIRRIFLLLQKMNQFTEGICFSSSFISFPVIKSTFCLYAIFYQYADSGQQKIITLHSKESSISFVIHKNLIFKQIKYADRTESHHIKDINLQSNKIFLGIKCTGNAAELFVNQQTHAFQLSKRDRITIGESFIGILKRFLWHEGSEFNKKYLKEKRRSEFFVSYLADLQKLLTFKGRLGFYMDSQSVFFLTQKMDINFQNILINKNINWIDNKVLCRLIISELDQSVELRDDLARILLEAIRTQN